MLTCALILEALVWSRRCRLPRALCLRFLHKFHYGEDIADAPYIDVEAEAALLLAYDYALMARIGLARLDNDQLELLLIGCLHDDVNDESLLANETHLALCVTTAELLWCDIFRGARQTAELLAPDRTLYDRWRANITKH
jgi:hypothetical protein